MLPVLAILFCAGCGSGPAGLVAGMGKVTLDGEPVEGASVVFMPTADDGLLAAGRTDQEGRFTLATNEALGVRPGHYKVSVGKQELLAAEAPVRAGKKSAEDYPAVKKMQTTGASRNHLPEVYLAARTSPLEVDVPPGGN
jgi:hypothetical protein